MLVYGVLLKDHFLVVPKPAGQIFTYPLAVGRSPGIIATGPNFQTVLSDQSFYLLKKKLQI